MKINFNSYRNKLDLGDVLGYALVIASLAIQIPRFTYTFIQTDGNIGETAVATFTGPGFAILVAGGAAYCWYVWHYIGVEARANSRLAQNRWVVLVFLGLQVLIEPLIVWPVMVSTIEHMPLEEVLRQYNVLIPWALLVAALPVFVLAGVSIAHAMRRAIVDEKQGKAKRSVASAAPASQSDFHKTCFVCKAEFDVASAYSGHFRDEAHRKVKEEIDAKRLRRTGNALKWSDGRDFDFDEFVSNL